MGFAAYAARLAPESAARRYDAGRYRGQHAGAGRASPLRSGRASRPLREKQRMSNDRFGTAAALFTVGLACAGGAEAATLAGRLTYPGEALPPMTVVARDAAGENVFSTHAVRGQSSYRLAVRPGAYVVFAVPDAAPDPRLRGAHTEYSLCARDRAKLLAGRCRTGALVVVKVA